MSNVVTEVIDEIKTDIETAWQDVKQEAVADAKVLWADFRGAVTAVLPEEYTLLKNGITKIIGDGITGDIAGVETELLNLGGETLNVVRKIGSAMTQAIIGIVNAAPSTPSLPQSGSSAAAGVKG